MKNFILRDEYNYPFIGIPSKDGPLSFETEEQAQLRCDQINESGIYDHKLHVSYGPDHPEYKHYDLWMRSGSLLYRVTDERNPRNRDEIWVTIANSSRSDYDREFQALKLLKLLNSSEI